jgi:pyridoxine 5-phosphate synthase
MASLGVNIDHIANVRQARRSVEPDPVTYALLAELGGRGCYRPLQKTKKG